MQAGRTRSHYHGLSANSNRDAFRNREPCLNLLAPAKRTATRPILKSNHIFKRPEFWMVDRDLVGVLPAGKLECGGVRIRD